MSELLQNYLRNRDKLDSALKSGLVPTSSCSDHVGLINQGSTCYLNSLIQCLYYNLCFRVLILQAKPDSAILVALQELFAHLQLSSSQAVNTKDLVTAFGWSRGQVFEQHDVHELFSLLLNALGDGSTELNSQLPDLFEGTIKDVLLCPACNHKRENTSAFLNLSLDLNIPDIKTAEFTEGLNLKKSMSKMKQINGVDMVDPLLKPQCNVELSELLGLHMRTETLDSDNKWLCSGCNDRVQALKYHEYKILPKSLMIHFKRFRYNTVTRKREKVKLPVYFPYLLDTSVLTCPVRRQCAGNTAESSNLPCTHIIKSSADEDSEGDKSSEMSDLYRLHSILLHTGTANGGHYKAYVIDSPSGRWLECNDASVSELTSKEEASLFLQKESMSSPESNSSSSHSVDQFNVGQSDGAGAENDMNRARNKNNVVSGCDVNEIYPSVNKSAEVSLAPDGDLSGGRIRPRRFTTLSNDVLRENAYMLLYQKISEDCMKEVSRSVQGSKEIEMTSCGERKEAAILKETCLAAIPLQLKFEIISKNEKLEELRYLYEVHKKVLIVKVMYNYFFVEAIKKLFLNDCSGSIDYSSLNCIDTIDNKLHEEGDVRNRNGNKKKKSQLQNVTLSVLNTDTMDDLLIQICVLLGIPSTPPLDSDHGNNQDENESKGRFKNEGILENALGQTKVVGNKLENAEDEIKRELTDKISIVTKERHTRHSGKYLHRLRAFNPVTGRDGETFGSRSKESLEKLGFRVSPSMGSAAQSWVTLRLESRREEDEPFVEISDKDMCLDVIIWSKEVSEAYAVCYNANSRHFSIPNSNSGGQSDSNNVKALGLYSDVDTGIDCNVDISPRMEDMGKDFDEKDGFQTKTSLHFHEEVLTAATHNILVPGELSATVGALRASIAALLNVLESDLILILNNGRSISELDIDKDHQTLGRTFGIKSGDTVFAEIKMESMVINESCPDSSGKDVLSPCVSASGSVNYVSQALTTFIRLSTTITIIFNDPRLPSNIMDMSDSTFSDYLKLKTSSYTLLKDLKFLIADELGIHLHKDVENKNGKGEGEVDDFYMAKSSSAFAPQYKDYMKSLSDVGLCDQSVVFLKMGRGCWPGEHVLRLEVETMVDSAINSCPIPIDVAVPSDSFVSASASVCGQVSYVVSESISTMSAAIPLSVSAFDSSININPSSSSSSYTINTSNIKNTLRGSSSCDIGNDGRISKKMKIVSLCQMNVHEQSSVLHLKEQLLSSWDSLKSENTIPEKPLSVHHIRLRDGKTASSTSLGSILRNERILTRCLLGLTDGRRIVVQMLPVPEIIHATDWILSVRLATYSSPVFSLPSSTSASASHSKLVIPLEHRYDHKKEIEQSSNDALGSVKSSKVEESTYKSIKRDLITPNEFTTKKVHRTMDIPISRIAKVRDLYQIILNTYPHLKEPHCDSITSPVSIPYTDPADGADITRNADPDSYTGSSLTLAPEERENTFPELRYFSIAKAVTTGPPLSLKSCMKLLWDPSVLISSPDIPIDDPSLGIRDGTLLIIRGNSDWQRAQMECVLQESSGSGSGSSEVQIDSANLQGSQLPPWKSKSTLIKKRASGISTAAHTDNSSVCPSLVDSVKVRADMNSRRGSGRRVERGLILKSQGIQISSIVGSRQGTIMQTTLDLENGTYQNSNSLPLEINSEMDTRIVEKKVLSISQFIGHTVRRSISDSDVRSGILGPGLDLHVTPLDFSDRPTTCQSLYTSSTADGYRTADSVVGFDVLKTPVAPVKVVRALKKDSQGT